MASPDKRLISAPVQTPLYVDLDGTLLSTNCLWELLIVLVKTRFYMVFQLPWWLMRGKAYLKRQLVSHVTLDPALLPYRQSVIDFLKRERSCGRETILATGSDRLIAEPIARHVGLFSTVLASDGKINLTGRDKLSAILEHTGGGAFDYIGDSQADLPIWQHAAHAILVGPSGRLQKKVRRIAQAETLPSARRPLLRDVLRMLRSYQWSKNVLIFGPLMLAHRILDLDAILKCFAAIAAFSLAASSAYIINDLLDLESDRHHPHKRQRPLAAGRVPIPWAAATALLSVSCSVLIAATSLSPAFTALLLLYLVTTMAYSMALKRYAIVDVLVLAGFYTLRIFAGSVATDVPISKWLLAYSMFFFLSLAFLKRYSELSLLGSDGGSKGYLVSRGYLVPDADILRSAGPSSGYLAVVVFILYINSPEVLLLYPQHSFLWFIAPLFLYWITRVWLLAHRGQLHSDPVIFALTDRTSYVVALLIGGILLAGSWR